MIEHRRKYHKDEALYSIIPKPKRCADCLAYKPVEGTNPASGVCENVWGIIDPEAHCDEFIAKLPNRAKPNTS